MAERHYTGHRDNWSNKRFEGSPVGEHFCSSGYNFISQASVCCLDRFKKEAKVALAVELSIYSTVQRLFFAGFEINASA